MTCGSPSDLQEHPVSDPRQYRHSQALGSPVAKEGSLHLAVPVALTQPHFVACSHWYGLSSSSRSVTEEVPCEDIPHPTADPANEGRALSSDSGEAL